MERRWQVWILKLPQNNRQFEKKQNFKVIARIRRISPVKMKRQQLTHIRYTEKSRTGIK